MGIGLSDRHYAVLSAPERFALSVEAMARGDHPDVERLADTCPRLLYREEDASFRERMRLAHAIASQVCLNMRAGLAQIRLARLFHEQAGNFAGPSIRVAQAVFLYGREYGKWEAGLIDRIGMPDAEALVDAVEANPDLGERLRETREAAQEAVCEAAATLLEAVGDLHASDLLSQWEGFGRLCHESFGVAPLTVFRAFGLGTTDPAMEVRSVYPMVTANEATAAECARRWSTSWRRRIGR